MSNLQLPDVLDRSKHPLFQQKIYETQVSWSSKVSFSGCFLLLTTHLGGIWLMGCSPGRWSDHHFSIGRTELQKSCCNLQGGGPHGTKLQLRTKSHGERFRTQVQDLGPKKQTSSDFASETRISDFHRCVVFFPGDQLRIGIDTWGATIGGAFAQYQGARVVLGAKQIGSLENCKKILRIHTFSWSRTKMHGPFAVFFVFVVSIHIF